MKHFAWILLFIITILICPVLTFGTHSQLMQSLPLRLAIFAACAFAGGLALLKIVHKQAKPAFSQIGALFLVVAILQTCVYIAASFLSDISTLPFTMNWSEASRYYYASLFFAQRIYGTWAPPTVLHPTRYLMLAVPFLIPNSPIWLHRAWQVFLWLVMPALTALLMARRPLQHSIARKFQLSFLPFVGAVIFLYLFVGDVYYHLLMPIVIILWAFAPAQAFPLSSSRSITGRPLSSISHLLPSAPRFLAVLFASAWAGISRVNWFPVPAMLAATLILLEEPVESGLGQPGSSEETGSQPGTHLSLSAVAGSTAWRRAAYYVLRIAAWGIFGVVTAFISQAAYVAWSGNSAKQFASSFTSDLLWSRLLPNPTYAPGILLAISFVSLPLLLIVASSLFEKQEGVAFWRRIHPLRLLGLGGMLAVLFATGLVVSVKIGGGNNIHNMDAYLIFLLVIATYFYVGAVQPDHPQVASVAPDAAERVSSAPGATAPSNLQSPTQIPGAKSRLSDLLAFAAALLPVILVVSLTPPQPPAPDPAALQEELQTIVEFSQTAHRQGGEVLFISERQLLTFGYIQSIPLVPEYERMFLMEAAMSGDPDYLGKLNSDLKNHRFALIVSEPLSRQQKGASEVFGAENDVWVRRVASPILCYYMPIKTLRTVRIQLLAPRPEKLTDCP